MAEDGRAPLSASEFIWPIRVYIEDTDAGGIVFYANYLKYLERARTELIRSLGYEVRSGLSVGVNFVVSHLSVDYRQPARLDDLIYASAKLEQVGASRLVFKQCVFKGLPTNELPETVSFQGFHTSEITGVTELVKAEVIVACLNAETGRPMRLPAEMKSALITKS